MTPRVFALDTLLSLLAITAAIALADDSAHDKAATFEELDYAVSASISGCGLCQQTGYCDQAFRGNPGQFCLTLFSGQPCCCPRGAQCVFNNQYACRCRRAMPPPAPHVRVVTRSTTTTTSSGDSSKFSTLLIVFILLLCGCCCFCAAREKEQEYCEPVYVATPATNYGATQTSQPQYGYAYPSAPPYIPESNQSNSLAAGAAGGVAGLAAGLAIGSMFGGGGRDTTTTTTTTTSYFGGDTGFAPTSYEFAGDTGGGDYGEDYGGDSGGDFAGDS
ncbi:hypothetical protein PINS_up020156 [Pythium insidiosum]|nr:hypothetical protein PINS_up020156 [Pythium insidiosum]